MEELLGQLPVPWYGQFSRFHGRTTEWCERKPVLEASVIFGAGRNSECAAKQRNCWLKCETPCLGKPYIYIYISPLRGIELGLSLEDACITVIHTHMFGGFLRVSTSGLCSGIFREASMEGLSLHAFRFCPLRYFWLETNDESFWARAETFGHGDAVEFNTDAWSGRQDFPRPSVSCLCLFVCLFVSVCVLLT